MIQPRADPTHPRGHNPLFSAKKSPEIRCNCYPTPRTRLAGRFRIAPKKVRKQPSPTNLDAPELNAVIVRKAGGVVRHIGLYSDLISLRVDLEIVLIQENFIQVKHIAFGLKAHLSHFKPLFPTPSSYKNADFHRKLPPFLYARNPVK
jgi:hypothetical protein